MKSAIFLAVGVIVLTASWPGFPSFDWKEAAIVGGGVFVVTAVALTVAILTPSIPIVAGATMLGTCVAIGGIALVAGIAGAVIGGLSWRPQGDIKRAEVKSEEPIEHVNQVSNQLDICFDRSDHDQKLAADFQCTLIYEETDLQSPQPTVTTKKIRIEADNGQKFYAQVEQKMKEWLTQRAPADADGQPRRVAIHMDPFPGEGVCDQLSQLAKNNGIRKCEVTRVELSGRPCVEKDSGGRP